MKKISVYFHSFFFVKKSLAIAILVMPMFCYTQDFNYEWGMAFGGTAFDNAEKLLVDSSGNVYATGHFEDVVVIGPPWNETTLYSNGSDDVFLLKFSPMGQLLWSFTFGGAGDDRANCITIDDQENIYLAGLFQGTADFDPAPGVVLDITSQGSSDIYILKLDQNGSLIWVKTIGDYGGGTDPQSAEGVAIDPAGNVLVTGVYKGIADFDPGVGIAEEEPVNDNFFDVFILKLDTDGNFIWVKSVGSDLDDESKAIDTDSEGNSYIIGRYLSTADFDPDDIATFNVSAGGYKDIFILRLTPDGNFSWCQTFDCDAFYHHSGNDIRVDQYDNVYAVGQYYDNIDFNPSGLGGSHLSPAGSADGFLLKLDSSGVYQWSRTIGGYQTESMYSVSLDEMNQVYVTGYHTGEIFQLPLFSDGFSDILLIKYDSDGDLLAGFSIGGTLADSGRNGVPDENGNLYLFGNFEGTFDADPGIDSVGFVSNGYSDMTLIKFSQPLPPPPPDTSSAEIQAQTIIYKVYPNPFNDYLVIDNPTGAELWIVIHDAMGKDVLTVRSSASTIELATAGLSAGVYFITLSGFSEMEIYSKLIKS